MTAHPPPIPCDQALAALWHGAGLPPSALAHIQLGDTSTPVLPSSFCVATAAQASVAAAALAAAELWQLRQSTRLPVQVCRTHATLACTGHFAIDGRVPALWDKIAGLYPCGADLPGAVPAWVRIHTNFTHHRDGLLRLLGLPEGPHTERAAVAQALRRWAALDVEQAAADADLVVAALRSVDDWDAHPQATAVAAQPLVALQRLDSGGPATAGPTPPWLACNTALQAPLQGLRVLDLTRILAGPVAGRLLATLGADVLMVNAPHLPNIEAIADLSRGKRSCLIDLRQGADRARFNTLVQGCQVFLQGYRPGALAAHGYSAEALARQRPGIVVAELSAYGWTGPWAGRRGFDSLVQTATGFNLAEAAAAGKAQPQALPMQTLDYAAGHLLAFGIQAALIHQATQGGSWRVRVSLAGAGHWLRSLGRQAHGLAVQTPDITPLLGDSASGFGQAGGAGLLRAVRPLAPFPTLALPPLLPAMPPGSHAPIWPTAG